MLKAAEGASGQANITVTVTDAQGHSVQDTFKVTVKPDTTANGGANGGPVPAGHRPAHDAVQHPGQSAVGSRGRRGRRGVLRRQRRHQCQLHGQRQSRHGTGHGDAECRLSSGQTRSAWPSAPRTDPIPSDTWDSPVGAADRAARASRRWTCWTLATRTSPPTTSPTSRTCSSACRTSPRGPPCRSCAATR